VSEEGMERTHVHAGGVDAPVRDEGNGNLRWSAAIHRAGVRFAHKRALPRWHQMLPFGISSPARDQQRVQFCGFNWEI